MSKIQTLSYNLANSVIIKNAISLNIIHGIFNLPLFIVPVPSLKYLIVYNAIVRDNSEIIVEL